MQSGGIPLRAIAAIESFLNLHAEGPDSGCSEPVFVWLGTILIAVGAGLRLSEARSAALRADEPCPDEIISGDFTPKCSVSSRINLKRMRFAFDAAGVLLCSGGLPGGRPIAAACSCIAPCCLASGPARLRLSA